MFLVFLTDVVVPLSGCSVQSPNIASKSTDDINQTSEAQERRPEEMLNDQMLDEKSLFSRGLDRRPHDPSENIDPWPTVILDKHTDK